MEKGEGGRGEGRGGVVKGEQTAVRQHVRAGCEVQKLAGEEKIC
jgi:hypothetical protein